MTVTKDRATDAGRSSGPAKAKQTTAGSAGPAKTATKKAAKKPIAALRRFRDRVRGLPGGATTWRVGVTVLGVAIIVGGIVLLPLPGPGWLIIFAGLGVLATEYDWAKRLLRFARRQVGRWTDWVKRQPRWVQALTGLLGAAFLAGIFFVVYLVLYA